MSTAASFAPQIKAVVFDAYGTLFDVNSAATRLKQDIGPKFQEVSDLWRSKQLAYTWLRSLMGTYVNFEELTGAALDHALETYKVDKELKGRLMELYMKLDAYPEVPEVLRKLRSAGLKTAILSNGNPGMLGQATESAKLDSLLDAVLSVDSVKIYKPDARVYALATGKFGLEKHEILFVSSNGWDVHGASKFGFNVFWCNRGGAVDDYGLPGKADAEGKSLNGVADLLGL